MKYSKEPRRGLSRLILSSILTFKCTFERIFRGFISNRQRGVVPKIFGTNTWTKSPHKVVKKDSITS